MVSGKNRRFDADRNIDQGYAWVILLVCFLATILNSVGFTTSGIVYAEFLEQFRQSKSVTSLPSSILVCLTGVGGIITGPIIKWIGIRPATVLGFMFMVSGYLISVFATGIPYLTFSYGFVGGLGHGMTYVTCMVPIQSYFDKKRPFATGIAVGGMSAGSFIWNPVVHIFLEVFGLRGTFLITSGLLMHGIVLALLLRPLEIEKSTDEEGKPDNINKSVLSVQLEASIISIPQLVRHSKRNIKEVEVKEKGSQIKHCCFALRNSLGLKIFTDSSFLLYMLAVFTNNLGQGTPYIYLVDRAKSLGVPKMNATILMIIAGATNTVGRFVAGFIANLPCANHLFTFASASFLNGLMMTLSPLLRTFPLLCLYAAVYGLLIGAALGNQTIILVDMLGVKNFPVALGTLNTVIGFGYVIAIPFTGMMYDVTGSYDIPFHVNGSFLMTGACILYTIFLFRRRTKSVDLSLATEDEEKAVDLA